MKKLAIVVFIFLISYSCSDTRKGITKYSDPLGITEIFSNKANQEELYRTDPYTLFGSAIITCYYSIQQRDSPNELGLEINDFIVIDGPKLFMDHYKELIKDGNSINILNDKRELVITLTENKSYDIKSKLRMSTKERPKKVYLHIPMPVGRESSSYFDIVKVLDL
jgi:hypothetical protein